MEQRTLRLGDIVDDYCPRERRVTNHAIVAIVENTIRQTRCSTCEAEHEYKDAKVPKKRTRADGSDLAGGVPVTPKAATNGTVPDNAEPTEIREPETPASAAASNGAESPVAPADPAETSPAEEQGPVVFTHRPLIRASLPKTDSDPPPQRPAPEFTMHQRHGRGFGGGGGGRGGFRHGHSFHSNGSQPFRGGGHQNNSNGSGNEPDGNRDPQSGRPPAAGGGPGGPGGGGGRRRRRRRR